MTNRLLPPEWAPQTAIQLTWPRPDGDFADWFEAVEDNFIRLAVAISRYQSVLIGTEQPPEALRERLVAAGALPQRLAIYPVRSNDVWARDHGPITVLRDGQPLHLDFQFNGWGGKFDARLDNTLTQQLAAQGALTAPVETVDFVLEGGGIDVDSQGSLLTTRRCLLAPTRNPQLSEAQIEALLKDKLGARRILWLQHGDLLGDDTDGHRGKAGALEERRARASLDALPNDPETEGVGRGVGCEIQSVGGQRCGGRKPAPHRNHGKAQHIQCDHGPQRAFVRRRCAIEGDRATAAAPGSGRLLRGRATGHAGILHPLVARGSSAYFEGPEEAA